MGVLTRFKSNERLQAEALDILNELIRRDLLIVDVSITSPFCSFESRASEAYVAGSQSLSGTDLFRAQITGEMPKNNKHAGPGIALRLRHQFRFGSQAEEQRAIANMKNMGL